MSQLPNNQEGPKTQTETSNPDQDPAPPAYNQVTTGSSPDLPPQSTSLGPVPEYKQNFPAEDPILPKYPGQEWSNPELDPNHPHHQNIIPPLPNPNLPPRFNNLTIRNQIREQLANQNSNNGKFRYHLFECFQNMPTCLLTFFCPAITVGLIMHHLKRNGFYYGLVFFFCYEVMQFNSKKVYEVEQIKLMSLKFDNNPKYASYFNKNPGYFSLQDQDSNSNSYYPNLFGTHKQEIYGDQARFLDIGTNEHDLALTNGLDADKVSPNSVSSQNLENQPENNDSDTSNFGMSNIGNKKDDNMINSYDVSRISGSRQEMIERYQFETYRKRLERYDAQSYRFAKIYLFLSYLTISILLYKIRQAVIADKNINYPMAQNENLISSIFCQLCSICQMANEYDHPNGNFCMLHQHRNRNENIQVV